MIAYVFDINTKEVVAVLSGSYEYVTESAYALMCNCDGLAATLESEELIETTDTNYISEEDE